MNWILWLIVITAIVVAVVMLALGRGDGLAEEEPDDVIVRLPEGRPMLASDVESMRLPLAIRGYQMSAVDEVLDRLAAELALRDAQIRQLQGQSAASDRDVRRMTGDGQSDATHNASRCRPSHRCCPQVVWDAVTDWPRSRHGCSVLTSLRTRRTASVSAASSRPSPASESLAFVTPW